MNFIKVLNYLFPLYLTYAFGALAQEKPEAKFNERPNIIFILADDLGWGELGCYGNTFNETPNLDQLAREGMKFNQAYAAAPVCSPTRVSIVTGQYPARAGITDVLVPKSTKYLMESAHITVNEALSGAGYHTGMIGKWHMDTRYKDKKGSPEAHGFNEVIGTETKYIAGGDYFYPYDKISTFTSEEEGEFLTDRLSGEAVNFIRRNNKRPFFLYLSYYSVHTILDAPQHLLEKYRKKFNEKYGEGMAQKIFDGPENKRHEADHLDNPYLAAMLERIDAGVGSIMDELEKQGIAEKTLLVFFSDNGGTFKVANNGGLRSFKGWLYEGGIRQPLLMRLPDKIKQGIETDVPVLSIDFYPTFLELANVRFPDNYILDGASLVPLITEAKSLGRDTLFWHYPAETGVRKAQAAGAVRIGDYKLIDFYQNNKTELYNLSDDSGEAENLINEMPEKAEEMLKVLNSWKQEVEAEEFVAN